MSGTTKASVKSNTATNKSAAKAKTTKAAKTGAKSKTGAVKVKKTVKKPVVKKSAAKSSSKNSSKVSKATKAAATRPAKAKVVSQQHEHTVHQVSALHMPAAPRVHSVTKTKINEAWMWVAFFLTFLFVYSVAENVVNAKSGLTGSPSTYAAIPALATAVVVWKANRTKSTYTGMVVVLSMLGAGLFIWLFGVTNASLLLFS